MNTVEKTKELNSFPRFLAKLNIQLKTLEDKIGVAVAPPLGAILLFGLFVDIIVIKNNAYSFSFSYATNLIISIDRNGYIKCRRKI